MRVHDLGVVRAHSASPMALIRGENSFSRDAVELFNRDYSDDSLFSLGNFRQTRISELFDVRKEEERRIFEDYQNSEGFERRADIESWVQALRRVEDFRDIHPDMHLPILWHKPVREAVIRGEMEGFEGIDASVLGEDDPFERLINNGTGEISEDGTFELNWRFETDDPELSYRDLDVIEEMRLFIDQELIVNGIDPTNSRNEIG